MSTANTLTNGSAPLPTLPELQAGAIAALDYSTPRPQSADNGNLGSLWTLLNERVARAATSPLPTAQAPQTQTTASLAEPSPVSAAVADTYGTAVSETYVVADTTLAAVPTSAPQAIVTGTETAATPEIVVQPQAVTPRQVAETPATPEPSLPTRSEILTPTVVTFAPEPPTVTPLKELLTANARRKTIPPVRLENALRGNTFVLSAHSQGELLPNIMLELSAPLGKTIQTASRTGENSTESNLLATLESIETGGEEGTTSLKAIVGYNSVTPDIVIEVSCNNGGDWQFHTQENGSDVSVEWEVIRQKGKAIVIAATIGRAKGAEDVIIELSRTLVTPAADGAVTPQWRNLVELKQPTH